jgi:PKD repeat protein
MKKEIFFVCLSLVLMISIVSASFEVDENSSQIETSYSEGEFVRGDAMMSFSWHENKKFTSNFGENGKDLLDTLLESGFSSGVDFDCNPSNCEDNYQTIGSASTTVNFNTGQKKLYGFKMVGNDVGDILKFDFNITSGAGASCSNQISVDLFNDGIVDFYNSKNTSTACGAQDFGCFKGADAEGFAIIDNDNNNRYCENITLPPGPGYRLGAYIKESQTDKSDLRLTLYNWSENSSSKKLDHCLIKKERFTGTGQPEDVFCDVDFSSQYSINAFVCLRLENDVDADYQIRFESTDPCGGVGHPINNPITAFTRDYEIYSRPLKYASMGESEFGDDTYQGGLNLDVLIEKYILNVYNNSCTNDCILPVGFWGIDQEVTMHDGRLRYKSDGNTQETGDIYGLSSTGFTINSSLLSLDIEKMGFAVPSVNGTSDFYLCFDENQCKDEDDSILSEEINVLVGFSFGIGPKFALIGKVTTFTAFTSETIDSSEWNFGDGSSSVESNDNTAQHKYTSEGNYEVTVTLFNSNGGESTKKFKVLVGDAQTSANITIKDYESRIKDLENNLQKFPLWVKEEVETQIDLDGIETALEDIKRDFNKTDANYSKIINDLLEIDVPKSLSGQEGTLPAAIGYDEINVAHLEDASGKISSNKELLKSGIVGWISENYGVEVEFQTITAVYDFEESDVLTRYDIKLSQKTSSSSPSFLIIDHSFVNVEFKSSYSEESVSSGSGVSIPIDSSGEPNSVEFLIIGSGPSVEDLAAYISPSLEAIEGKPLDPTIEKPTFRWGFFFMWLSILIFLIFIAYIALQYWYKRHYEHHLFRNPNDLYNLINFIYNSRKSGMNDSDIRKKLREKKWRGEQISYAFKKIDGKRTGLWEIPLFKFLENKKVKEEIQKKQGGAPVDARFIKRPSF